MIACSVDDFPAPFGPIRPTISPGFTSSDRLAHRVDRAVADRELLDRERGHSIVLRRGALAEVGGGDAEMRADLVRRPLGERRSLVEHVDALADLEHERDVVVDEQHAGAAVADGADRGREARHLRLGKAGRRLVHQHEARLGRECPGDAEPPLVAVRQRRRRSVGVRGEAEQLEQLVAPGAAPRGPRRRRRAPRPRRSPAPRAPPKAWLCWNVRASPCRPRRYAGQRVTSRSSSSTRPRLGRSKPLRTLTSVDLPAPFGPISPTHLARPRARARRRAAPRRPRTNARRRRPGAILRASPSARATAAKPYESGLFGTFFATIVPFSIGHVVVDLDHAVLAAEDRVQLLREADLARERRDVVELLHHRRELRADERAVRPLDRRDDAVDRGRAGDEAAGRRP